MQRADWRIALVEHLQELVDDVRIEAATATPVPAPPYSKFPGDHLFVNCLYTATVAKCEPNELVLHARSDLLAIVEMLIDKNLLAKTRSLCVSFLGNRTDTGNERLYRYSVGSESYPTDSRGLTIDMLLEASDSVESSDVDEISKLLS